MVGNNVEDQAHAFRLQRLDKRVEFFGGADFGIDLRWIDDVVPMRAARPCLQDRRSIEVCDAQVVQVIDNPNGINTPEVAIELEAICRNRNSHCV